MKKLGLTCHCERLKGAWQSHFYKRLLRHFVPRNDSNLHKSKLISFLLALTFLFQQVAWAGPASYTLAPESSFEKRSAEKGVIHEEHIINRLFLDEKPAAFGVWSDDKELGEIVMDKAKETFVPDPLQGLREKYVMWKYIRNPSVDVEQLKTRQDLLEVLKDSELLPQITALKDQAYLIDEGINELYRLVQIDEFRALPAIVAYRSGYRSGGITRLVMSGLKKIKQGKPALKDLADTMSKIDNPLVKSIVDSLEQDVVDLAPFDDSYFLKGEDYASMDSYDKSEEVYKRLIKLGSFVEFANIILKDDYCRATYSSEQPAEYSKGWNFVRDKAGEETQRLNDSALDQPVVILSGSNMGGKSFHLVQSIYMQLLAQSFGYVPAERANFKIHDSILYLDRASTRSDHDLSAYGVDVKNWIGAFSKKAKTPLLFVDEGFSTTSGDDQFAMLMAVKQYLSGFGAKMHFATHNEDFINACKADEAAGIYHFPIKIGEGQMPEYSNILTAGVGDSMALEVVEGLGMPRELVKLARQYRDGVFEKAQAPTGREWKEVKGYTPEQRNKLKGELEYPIIFGKAKTEEEKALRIYSHDGDFCM
ncbi:hypothetical protein ACFLQ8_02505 [Candidatus Auribacterota bacterium]